MKFTNYLKSIDGVTIYPIISLVLFTAVFAVVVAYVFTADKKAMQEKANIPNL
jgi:cbb3-type cytochrome oxidase subunit 3